jgi:DNA-binding NarL/FixJ family response regulator
MTAAEKCIRIVIIDPSELMVAGLTRVLTQCRTRHFVVVPPEHPYARPDILLYNVEQHHDGSHDVGLHRLLCESSSTIIATYREEPGPGVEPALTCGAHGAVSMRLPASELIEQVTRIHHARLGEVERGPREDACHPEVSRVGLTPRECEVLGLIGTGLTNPEIADRLFISLNTVKTYIRGAYRKIDVERRSQAVVWAMRQGLTPTIGLHGARLRRRRGDVRSSPARRPEATLTRRVAPGA